MTKDLIKRGFTLNTAEKKEQFLELYRDLHCNVSETCRAMGMSRRTFYNWRNASKRFESAVADVEEELIDFAESKLRSRIDKEDTIAIIFFLKTKGKRRGYMEKQQVEHSGNIDSKLTIEVVDTK